MILRLVSAPIPHASQRPRLPHTDNSRIASSHQGNHKDCPYIFCAPHKSLPPIPNTNIQFTDCRGEPCVRPYNNRVRPFNKIVFVLILHSYFVLRTKQIGLRAETQTRLCECERRKTSNCLSRRRVFDVQRTSTRSGSAWCVEP